MLRYVGLDVHKVWTEVARHLPDGSVQGERTATEPEVIAGEHAPPQPYRSRSRLFVYKKADPAGTGWRRYLIDDRFEHHDGAKVIELEPGRFGIMSHGWRDSLYVHLWEPD